MILYYGGPKNRNALIAQLDRASGYGPEGREFESSSARQRDAGLDLFLGPALFFVLLLDRSVWHLFSPSLQSGLGANAF